MGEDEKMQVGKIEQLTDKPAPEFITFSEVRKRLTGGMIEVDEDELAHLREIERLARGLMEFDKRLVKELSSAPFWRAWEALRKVLRGK